MTMVYEIHTNGGGDFLVAILNGVNLFLRGSAYLTLNKAIVLLELIFFIEWECGLNGTKKAKMK